MTREREDAYVKQFEAYEAGNKYDAVKKAVDFVNASQDHPEYLEMLVALKEFCVSVQMFEEATQARDIADKVRMRRADAERPRPGDNM